jgi:hypothetical protein
MSSLITLLFAPSFLFFIHYFHFKQVVLFYIAISLFLVLYAFWKKKKLEDFIVLSIYLFLLTFAYFFASIAIVKFIPVFTSMAFFTLFAQAALYKKELILKLTQKFYKKEFSNAEIEYLKLGDSYWAISILIYMIIQIILALWATDTVWAIYSSVGWYIYFLLILGIQIIYGRLYALKVSS